MRIWIDPAKMLSFNMSTAEITAAIRAQNAQVASGTIGDLPNLSGQGSATVVVSGQLSTVEQFLQHHSSGQRRWLHRSPQGCGAWSWAAAYATAARLNGKPARRVSACNCRPVATRWPPQSSPHQAWTSCEATSQGHELEHSLRQFALRGYLHHPGGETLLEAVALVFLVMFLFLQNWRYTVIPPLWSPSSPAGHLRRAAGLRLLDQHADHVRHGAGDRPVVDDAIVVVENVERIMSEEGLSPLEATRKAMGQIQAPSSA